MSSSYPKGVREDGTVEGRIVETHYLHFNGVELSPDLEYVAVIGDDGLTDVEIRVPTGLMLKLLGFRPPTIDRAIELAAATLDDEEAGSGRGGTS
ncbi:MAG: hypothetical protein AAGN66_05595 [Acidobacteriota bacterium]